MELLHGLISEELLKLSYDDRNAINDEIHGVQCLAVKETPELLRTSLDAFHTQLVSMPPSEKEVYIEIVRLKQQQIAKSSSGIIPQSNHKPWGSHPDHNSTFCCFADNENFRLRFLRCELFNIKKAVQRFINYLNISYEFFGRVALTRVVRIKDFSESELRSFRKGCHQVLPYRDRAGRCVIVNLGKVANEIDLLEQAKIRFFLGDAVTRDSIESQQKGIVIVVDATTKTTRSKDYTLESYRRSKKVFQALPSRVVAVHSCWPDTSAAWIFADFQRIKIFFTGADFVTKVRVHTGSEIEMRYNLRGYGIPMDLLPITKTGSIKVKYLNDWIRIRNMLEGIGDQSFVGKKSVLTRVVICPGLTDVVFRQGTPSMTNPGNVIFRDTIMNILEEHYSQHRYLEGHQQQPAQIEASCNWLIETTQHTKGGRFLEWDKQLNVWVKMTDRLKIKSKVIIAYRDVNKRFMNSRQKMLVSDNEHVGNSRPTNIEGGRWQRGTNCCRAPPTRDTRSDSNNNESSRWL